MFTRQNFAFFTLCAALFCACGEGDVQETVHYNGIRKTQVPYQNGKPHGEFKRWTSHGDLAESGMYQNGLREGIWTEWFTNGKVQSQGEYLNGKKQGIWKGFFQDGTTAWEHAYQDGEPTGTWTEFYPIHGNIRASGVRIQNPVKEKNSCFKNAEIGIRETFAPNGKRKRVENCKFGHLDGEVKTYYPGGSLESILEYKQGNLDGKATFFRAKSGYYTNSPGTPFRSGFYKNGIRDSIWTYYAKDGSVMKTSVFQNGNGIAYGELDSDGLDAETTFVAGVVHDSIRYKLPDRPLRFIEVWDKGEKKLLLAYYEKTGKLASEGHFERGKRNGFWRNWYENGTIKDSLFYKDGEPFGEQLYYDSTGKLYMRKNQFGKNGPMQVNFQ